jgi:hypothetical protein
MMPGVWNINVEAPNGAKAHFTFDTGKSKDPFGDMTRQFSELVCRMPEHDPELMTEAGRVQPRRQAQG